MHVPRWIASLFTVDDAIVTTQFSLIEDGAGGSENGGSTNDGAANDGAANGANSADSGADGSGGARGNEGVDRSGDARGSDAAGRAHASDSRESSGRDAHRDNNHRQSADEGSIERQKPIPLAEYVKKSEEQSAAKKAAMSEDVPTIPASIKAVKQRLNRSFHLPDNKDIVLREFDIGVNKNWHAIAVFVDGLASTTVINTNLLEPLMLLSHLDGRESSRGQNTSHRPPSAEHHAEKPSDETQATTQRSGDQQGDLAPSAARRMETVIETLLPSNQIAEVDSWKDAVAGILTGSTAIFVDGSSTAVIAESKGWEHRSVSTPQTENVVKGPHQAFTESFRANTALVRSMLRSEDLITEMLSIGVLGKTDVAVMYVHGLTNKRLVEEVKRRIKAVDVDYVADAGTLSQFLEDNPRVWIPQTLSTERPDRVAQMLSEGHVAIFVGQSSFVLLTPIVFFSLMQAAEDSYLRFPFGSFLRMIRWFALVVALLTPALYVSVTNYHPEMIPTDLMMAIAGSREQVPFPVVMEILLMEMAIELIREAGIRIPSIIGPTIGIVGALIIGQAAVQAGVVSPLLVIVISVTALASFTIPNYNLQFGVRIMRFVFLVVAALFGFYGLTLAIVAMLARMTIQQSLGVPLFSPVAPKSESSRDVFLRAPAFQMNQRPLFLHTQDTWRQQPYTRPWSGTAKTEPVNQKRQGNNNGDAGDKSDGS